MHRVCRNDSVIGASARTLAEVKYKGAISLCAEVGGVCPLFEWSSDPAAQAGFRATRGPSFRHLGAHEGINVEAARNDDLGFRCAKDPAAR